MKAWYRTIVAAFLGVFALVFCVPLFTPSAASPKLANYHIAWHLDDAMVKELAKWDLVVLDMEVQLSSPEQMKKLRALNPDITILAYITSQEIRQDALTFAPGKMRQRLAGKISAEWYATDASGARQSVWPATYLLNVADNGPVVNGKRFNQFLAEFVTTEILSTGLWDGVFYDNAWEGVSWIKDKQFDLDRNGVDDTDADAHWINGMRQLYNETRRLTNNRYLIIGNGGTKAYRDELDGLMLESFPNYGGWSGDMEVYNYYEGGGRRAKYMIINRNTRNSGKKDNYKSVRFGLASTLMGDGYYSFDHGDQNHAQRWWYDEYGVELGTPAGAAQSLGNKPRFQEDVWRRDYSNGLALVNATTQDQTVDLGGEYEKIIGTQDPKVNDGRITDKVKIAAGDGLLMYKTFRSINNVFFKNGSFARFYKSNGTRARNGFFVFEEAYPGGARIYNGDLDGDGANDKIVVTGARMQIVNSVGGQWFNDFPFGANYKGEMNVAVGKAPGSAEAQIVVAPSKGGKVIVYTYYGGVVHAGFYPLGNKYQGGFSVAVGNIDGGTTEEIVLGTGAGRSAEIFVYDNQAKKAKQRFYPFTSGYRGGANVTVGDFNADGKPEIAAVSTSGRNPIVRLFDSKNKKIGEFPIKGFFGSQVMTIGAADVDYGKHDEIVVMSDN